MSYQIPDYISFPLISAIAGPISLLVPFLGSIAMLLIGPLATLLHHALPPELVQVGVDVDLRFMWVLIGLNTPAAWIFFGSAFFLYGLIVGLTKYILERRDPAVKNTRLFFVAGLFTHIYPLLLVGVISLLAEW